MKHKALSIAAKPTMFEGVLYRSQTEVAWAVFFKHLKLEFTYEPKKIKLADGSNYIPDFYVEGLCA